MPHIPLIINPQRALIQSLSSNACQCLEQELNDALNNITNTVNTNVNKLGDIVTGALNAPATIINDTVLAAQNDLAAGFENQLKGVVADITAGITGNLDESCFLKPFGDFFAEINATADGVVGAFANAIRGLDLRLPTLDFNFKLGIAVNVCGAVDNFSPSLQSVFSGAGLSAVGGFDISNAFSGMTFPNASYEAMFKDTMGKIVNVGNMQGVVGNTLGAVGGRIDSVTGQISSGINAVSNWGKESARTVNNIVSTVKDPSAAVSKLVSQTVPPSAVAWAGQFASMFGFAPPGIAGGSFPIKPKDVNYLINKEVGKKLNEIMQTGQRITEGFFQGIQDALSGFVGLANLATEEGLGQAFKSVMGMEESSLTDAKFAEIVKRTAAEMALEGAGIETDNFTSVGANVLRSTPTLTSDQLSAIPGYDIATNGIAESTLQIEQSELALAEARQLRSNSSLTYQDKQEIDESIAAISKIRDEAIKSKEYFTQTRSEIVRENLTTLFPGTNDMSLAQVAGSIPSTESRFPDLVPIPGVGIRTESVENISSTGTIYGSSATVNEELARAHNVLTSTQETLNNANQALVDARDIRSSLTDPLEIAQVDQTIANIERSRQQTQNQLIEAQRAVAQVERDTIPYPGTRELSLSQPVLTAANDPRIVGFNGLTATQVRNLSPERQEIVLQLARNRDFKLTGSSPSFHAVITTPTTQAITQDIFDAPGSSLAISLRSNIENHEEVLVTRAMTAIEDAETALPEWLASLIPQFSAV